MTRARLSRVGGTSAAGRASWCVLALVAAACCLAPRAPRADDEEATDLRVRKLGTGLELTWRTPVVPPDSQQVRRCALATVDDSSGVCIAEGLLASRHVDAVPPAGDHFYLVSGLYGTREGPLGDAWNGTSPRPRTAPACDSPPNPGVARVLVFLEEDFETCGSDIRVWFDAGASPFLVASCAGIQTGPQWSTFGMGTLIANPEVAYAVCASSGAGARGPGLVTSFDFDVGDCPVDLGDFRLARCEFTACSDFSTWDLPCTIMLQ